MESKRKVLVDANALSNLLEMLLEVMFEDRSRFKQEDILTTLRLHGEVCYKLSKLSKLSKEKETVPLDFSSVILWGINISGERIERSVPEYIKDELTNILNMPNDYGVSRLVRMVKYLREKTGLGLYEAKTICENKKNFE